MTLHRVNSGRATAYPGAEQVVAPAPGARRQPPLGRIARVFLAAFVVALMAMIALGAAVDYGLGGVVSAASGREVRAAADDRGQLDSPASGREVRAAADDRGPAS